MKIGLFIIFLLIIMLNSLNCDEYHLSHVYKKDEMKITGAAELIFELNQDEIIYYNTVIGTVDTLYISNDSLFLWQTKYAVEIKVDSLFLKNENEKLVWWKYNKTFYAFINSDYPEVNSDIEYSTNQIKEILENNKIQIVFSNYKSDNAYLLINEGEKRSIKSALTDADLLQICKEFYKLDIK